MVGSNTTGTCALCGVQTLYASARACRPLSTDRNTQLTLSTALLVASRNVENNQITVIPEYLVNLANLENLCVRSLSLSRVIANDADPTFHPLSILVSPS